MAQEPNPAASVSGVSAATAQLPNLLSVALWASPLVTVSGYLGQVALRFPPQSKGAGFTALILVLGLVLGALTAVFGIFQLGRRPDAWTKKSGSLLALNVILLLMALAFVPGLFR